MFTQLPVEMAGGNGKVIFIDTEGTFRPERVQTIAHRFGVDPSAVLENILCARAYTSEHQAELLTGVAAKMVCDCFIILHFQTKDSRFLSSSMLVLPSS